MNRSKLYIAIIVALVISNAILIGFMVFPKHERKHGDIKHGIRKMIVKKLDFDETQTIAFEKLIENHRKDIHKIDKEILKTKRLLFEQLKTGNLVSPDSLQLEIASFQQEAERLKFNHLREIKNLCTPAQQDNFDALMDELGNILQKKRRRKN